MRQQRTGRQKFQDLRLLTFQDWIIPHYNNNNHHQRDIVMMKNHNSLPVFSYTKMETGPPLSTINSQFAWAGHVLPDLVQEQSDRLLRRLERPMTAGNRTPISQNSKIKGRKLSRPSTAVSTSNLMKDQCAATSIYHMDYTNSSDLTRSQSSNDTQSVAVVRRFSLEHSENQTSPQSERSSSPDFIANLYKEYEKKISEHNSDILTPHDDLNSSPRTKLLRRPSPQFKVEQKNIQTRSTQEKLCCQTEKIHCVVKLPCEQIDSNPQKNSRSYKKKNSNLLSKSDPPRSETWLDLSEICKSSDEDIENDKCEIDLRRPSVASNGLSSLKLLDLINECDNAQERENAPLAKSKISRPSSKHLKKSRPKSRLKRRKTSLSQVEESTKEYAKDNKRSESCLRQVKSSDKLREEIETQMSKLDFDGNSARPVSKDDRKASESVMQSSPKTNNEDVTPKIKSKSWTVTTSNSSVSSCSKSSIPLKRIPIQILSDPFTTNMKVYHGKVSINADSN